MEVTDGITIRNNAIYENAVDGIKGGGSGTITIENNTIHDMVSGEYHGDCIQYMGNEAVIRNNVFYNCTQDIYIDTYSDPAGSNPRGDFYIYNNIVYNPDPGPGGTEGYYNGISIDQRYNSINALYVFNNTIVNQNSGHGGFGNGTNPITDPDFTLQSGSPAVDGGTDGEQEGEGGGEGCGCTLL